MIWPVSVNQARLLAMAEYTRGKSVAFDGVKTSDLLRIDGLLSLADVQSALDVILQRHLGLRTAFLATDPGASGRFNEIAGCLRSGYCPAYLYRQHLRENVHFPLGYSNLSGCEGQELTREIQRVHSREASYTFDYNDPPMARGHLVKTGPATQFLLLICDHLVSDFWSHRLIETELTEILNNEIGNLKNAGIHFPDYARWECDASQSGEFDAAIRFWAHHRMKAEQADVTYHDFPGTLPAVTDQAPASRVSTRTLMSPCVDQLRKCAHSLNVTLHTLFLLAFAVAVARVLQTSIIPISMIFANRSRPDTCSSVGPYARGHVLPVSLDRNVSVARNLSCIRDLVLSCLRHQHVPSGLTGKFLGKPPREFDLRLVFDFVSIRTGDVRRRPVLVSRLDSAMYFSLASFTGIQVTVMDGGSTLSVLCGSDDRISRPQLEALAEDIVYLAKRFAEDPSGDLLPLAKHRSACEAGCTI